MNGQGSMFDELLGSEIVATAAVSAPTCAHGVPLPTLVTGGYLAACFCVPRVFSDDGTELCPSCGSELKRGECAGACSRIGAVAQSLVP